MNQGPWSQLEAKERELVRKYRTTWVMIGPSYESPMPPLPNCDEPHKVPSGFWRIGAVNDLGTLRVAAFIVEQSAARTSPVIDHLVTVDQVEHRSGLDFFWELPDQDENAMEGVSNTT